MSRVRYFFNSNVSMRKFSAGLNSVQINYKVDDSPSNFYPYYRLRFGDIMMVARTNCHRNVVCLLPVDDLMDEHQQIADNLAALFDTTITVEDFSLFGLDLPWAKNLVANQQHEDTAERWGFR